MPLRDALTKCYDLHTPKIDLLRLLETKIKSSVAHAAQNGKGQGVKRHMNGSTNGYTAPAAAPGANGTYQNGHSNGSNASNGKSANGYTNGHHSNGYGTVNGHTDDPWSNGHTNGNGNGAKHTKHEEVCNNGCAVNKYEVTIYIKSDRDCYQWGFI